MKTISIGSQKMISIKTSSYLIQHFFPSPFSALLPQLSSVPFHVQTPSVSLSSFYLCPFQNLFSCSRQFAVSLWPVKYIYYTLTMMRKEIGIWAAPARPPPSSSPSWARRRWLRRVCPGSRRCAPAPGSGSGTRWCRRTPWCGSSRQCQCGLTVLVCHHYWLWMIFW